MTVQAQRKHSVEIDGQNTTENRSSSKNRSVQIAHFEREAQQLDALLQFAIQSPPNLEHESSTGDVIDRLNTIGQLISLERASSFTDIVAKIHIWRLIAPEDVFDDSHCTSDERLAVSIMEDLERLAAQ